MMKHCILFFVSFAVLFAAGLTVKDGLKEAIKKSPELQEIYYLHQEVGKDVGSSRARLLPTLSVVGEHDFTKFNDAVYEDQTIKSNALEFKQNLFNGFSDLNRYEGDKARLQSAHYKLLEERNLRSLEFIENYINVLKNRDFLKVSKMSLENQKMMYKKIKKKVDVGLGRQLEERHAKSSLDLAELSFRVQQRNSSQELIKFSKLLNRKVELHDLLSAQPMFCIPKSFEELYSVVSEKNPTLKVALLNIDVVKQEYEASQAGYWPSLDLKADYYLSQSTTNSTQSNDYEVNLRLNFNIFNGLADSNRQEKQRMRIFQKNAILKKSERDLKNRVELAWFSYELNQDKYRYSKINVNSKREALHSYDYEFLLGRASLNAMLGATEDFYNALKDMANSYYELVLDYYRIIESTGYLYEVVAEGERLAFNCSKKDNLLFKLSLTEEEHQNIDGDFEKTQQCFSVLKEKAFIRHKPLFKSKTTGFLIKDTVVCSREQQEQWIRIEKGWVIKDDIKAVSIQY